MAPINVTAGGSDTYCFFESLPQLSRDFLASDIIPFKPDTPLSKCNTIKNEIP